MLSLLTKGWRTRYFVASSLFRVSPPTTRSCGAPPRYQSVVSFPAVTTTHRENGDSPDKQCLETQLQWGALFRQQGKIDQAVTLHYQWLDRLDVSPEQKASILSELCQDYLVAGLFDRAERLLIELSTFTSHRQEALHQLVEVYQAEKDWQNAALIAQILVEEFDAPLMPTIAHYYCEMAEFVAWHNPQYPDIDGLLGEALRWNPRCIRALLLSGSFMVALGYTECALSYLRRILEQDVYYLLEILPILDKHHLTTYFQSYIDNMRTIFSSQAKYRCNHCGFSGEQHHWQCPACQQWDTVSFVTTYPVNATCMAPLH